MTNSLINIIQNTCWVLFFVSILNIIVILPFIFYFFIVPKIEKRIGHQLEYNNFLGRYFPQWTLSSNVGAFIIGKYIYWKLTGKIKNNNPCCSSTPTLELYYDIREASKIEVLVSAFGLLNALIGGGGFIIICIMLWG